MDVGLRSAQRLEGRNIMMWALRCWLIRVLAGRDQIALNLWFSRRGLLTSSLRHGLYVNVSIHDCPEGFTVLTPG